MAARNDTWQMRGELRLQEPMAGHCTWRAGGAAARYYVPADLADLQGFLASLPACEPLLWLGLGSNLLVRDGGFPGTVIALLGALDGLESLGEGRIRAEAGVACAKVARFCSRAGLTGLEFFAGIPGTVGGALAMNAGAFGGETWPRVAAVETLDRTGRLHRRLPAEYRIGYRSVAGPAQEWFVAAEFALAPAEAASPVKVLLERRARTQPIGEPSCGSVFRNPEGDHAARLIEACGLKGRRRGGACVSEKHANFIINTGGATAADIEGLLLEVQATVERQFGIRLKPEVRIVGEPAEGAEYDG